MNKKRFALITVLIFLLSVPMGEAASPEDPAAATATDLQSSDSAAGSAQPATATDLQEDDEPDSEGEFEIGTADKAPEFTDTDVQQMLSDVKSTLDDLEEGSANLWQNGDVVIGTDGSVTLNLARPLPAGDYILSGMISTDYSAEVRSGFRFCDQPLDDAGGMAGNKTQIFEIVHDGSVQAAAFTLSSTAYSVKLFTGTTASAGEGCSSFWAGLRIQSGTDQNVYEPPVRPALPVPEETEVDETAFRGPGYIAYEKITSHDGYKEITFAEELPAGTYTILVNVSSTESSESRPSRIRTTSSAYNDTAGLNASFKRNLDSTFIFTTSAPTRSVFILASDNLSHSAGKVISINTFALYKGEAIPKDNRFDASDAIMYQLSTYGKCDLEPGVYTIRKPIIMPEHSILRGSGDASTIRLADKLPVREFSVKNKSARSLVGIDVCQTPDGGSEPLPAGLYRYTLNITSKSKTIYSTLCVCTGNEYDGGSIMVNRKIIRGEDNFGYFFSPVPFRSIYILAGQDPEDKAKISVKSLKLEAQNAAIAMNGYCTVKDLDIAGASRDIRTSEELGTRSGIVWAGTKHVFGMISGCRVHRFDCAGILGLETGKNIKSGLVISNCDLYDNNVGIFFRSNCEYNKVESCVIALNHYGILNRGGNNIIANCGVDSNSVGILIDEVEGTNNGHGNITGCTINHSGNNAGYGLIIRSTGRMVVSDCNIHYSNILIEHSNGNFISRCGFGAMATIEITGGGCSIVEGCIMRDTQNTVTLTNNTSSKVINCFTRQGTAVKPIRKN